MRLAFLLLMLLPAATLLAAPAPLPRARAGTRISVPAGPVKVENVRTKAGMVVRVTAGKVVVEGKSLFLGDGKVAMEIEATEGGMRFHSAWGMQGPSESVGTIGGDRWLV